MKVVRFALLAALAACLNAPAALAASGVKTFTGTVTGLSGSLVMFKNSSAATYSAELRSAVLTRKNGAVLYLNEIAVGDKVKITGTPWGSNSVNANTLQDLSLYPHNSTVSGKISGINLADGSFTLTNAGCGQQRVQINNLTTFKINNAAAAFAGLQPLMPVTVKGGWERNCGSVAAVSVLGALRYISIDFTGTLSLAVGTAFTVVGGTNVIYGVDAAKADLRDKGNKSAQLSDFHAGDSVHIWGKHISGSTAVIAAKIKNLSVSN